MVMKYNHVCQMSWLSNHEVKPTFKLCNLLMCGFIKLHGTSCSELIHCVIDTAAHGHKKVLVDMRREAL